MSFMPRRVRFSNVKTKTVIFTGGLNEAVTNIELKPGELTECSNYIEYDGNSHGYISAGGYERFDGTELASSIGVTFDENGDIVDDTAREARRSAINVVPGQGPILGVTEYNDKLFAFRDNAADTAAEMYEATSSSWTQVTGTTLNTDGNYDFIEGRLAEYNSNLKCLYWVDGVSDPHTYDGTTVTNITVASAPAGAYPTQVGIWKNRLFLAYPNGHLLFSAIGDPLDWTTAGEVGEIFIGDDITEIVEAPGGALVVFTKDTINVIYYEGITADFSFRMENFSPHSGAVQDTVKRLLGTLYFADDRGITTMQNVDAYGDFEASTVHKKVQRLYAALKGNITTAAVDREKNQYILFTNPQDMIGTVGLVFTFTINYRGDKVLRGAGVVHYPDTVECVTERKTFGREPELYFGSDNGYVYKYNSGTSFDGLPIATKMASSFYHYGQPSRWKYFRKIALELTADKGLELLFKNEFNYKDPAFPIPTTSVKSVAGEAGVYGVDEWGSFTWGGGAYLTQVLQNVIGVGVNMRILMQSNDKYRQPHILHNMITDYTVGSRVA